MVIIKKISRLLDILEDPNALKGLLRYRTNFSISSFRINLILSTYQSVLHTIIDGGANKGQYALAAASRYPMATIHCFEPDPTVYPVLVKNLRNNPRITTYPFALGDHDGKTNFFHNECSLVSSVLPIHADNYQRNYDSKRTREVEVEIRALHSLFTPKDIVSPTLLKLDLQGYELRSLKGAKELFECIDYIVLETAFVPLYENQPSFNTINDYLQECGFEFVKPLDFEIGKNLEIMEMDMFFRRTR